jgi:hypothetical protein
VEKLRHEVESATADCERRSEEVEQLQQVQSYAVRFISFGTCGDVAQLHWFLAQPNARPADCSDVFRNVFVCLQLLAATEMASARNMDANEEWQRKYEATAQTLQQVGPLLYTPLLPCFVPRSPKLTQPTYWPLPSASPTPT